MALQLTLNIYGLFGMYRKFVVVQLLQNRTPTCHAGGCPKRSGSLVGPAKESSDFSEFFTF